MFRYSTLSGVKIVAIEVMQSRDQNMLLTWQWWATAVSWLDEDREERWLFLS